MLHTLGARGSAAILLFALVACGGAGGAAGPHGTYCFNCQGVTRVSFPFTPAPPDPVLASLEVTFPGCPERPTTLPLDFDQGFVVKATPRPEHPDAPTGFAKGELQIEQCTMDRVRARLWLERDDGSRLAGAVDLPLTMATSE